MNIAELLKYAPKGMKMYSPIFGECKLDYVYSIESYNTPIQVEGKDGNLYSFSKEGVYHNLKNGECMLFPDKGESWEGFCNKNLIGKVVVYTDEPEPAFTDFLFGSYKGFGYVDTGSHELPYKTIIPLERFDPNDIVKSLIYKL